MKNLTQPRHAWPSRSRFVCLKMVLLLVGSLVPVGPVQAQQKVDHELLRAKVREQTMGGARDRQAKSSPKSQADQDLYAQSLNAARKALAAGDYATATELATLLVQGWPSDATAKELLAQAQRGTGAPTAAPVTVPAAALAPASANQSAPELDSLTIEPLVPPKTTKHEVSAAADFLYGQGTVTLPAGFGLKEALGIEGFQPSAISADRNSTYYGGTVTYSYGQAWHFDFSFVHGESSGDTKLDADWLGELPTNFTITDDWFQGYLRYTFPSLRGKKFFAYLRAGVSFVQADLSVKDALLPSGDLYSQEDSTQDVMGNFGFGLGYLLKSAPRFRLAIQLEAEGFYGSRTQDSEEKLKQADGLRIGTAQIDNTLYGGIVRLTLRLEKPLSRSGLFKLFLDAGVQAKFTIVDYDDTATSVPSEFLWGPYARLGVLYNF